MTATVIGLTELAASIPTRRQKRTWRRRCSRARYTEHVDRGFGWDGELFVFADHAAPLPARRIRPWWRR